MKLAETRDRLGWDKGWIGMKQGVDYDEAGDEFIWHYRCIGMGQWTH